MPKWLVVLLSVVGAVMFGGYFALSTVVSKRMGFDLAYDCLDTSGQHAISQDWYFHVNVHPPKISEKFLFKPTISDEEIRWDGDSVGHHFSGFIDRTSLQWEERIDGSIFHAGTCKRIT